MNESVEHYLHRLNVVKLNRKLRDSTDGAERKTLLALLAEEAAKAQKAGWPPLIA